MKYCDFKFVFGRRISLETRLDLIGKGKTLRLKGSDEQYEDILSWLSNIISSEEIEELCSYSSHRFTLFFEFNVATSKKHYY